MSSKKEIRLSSSTFILKSPQVPKVLPLTNIFQFLGKCLSEALGFSSVEHECWTRKPPQLLQIQHVMTWQGLSDERIYFPEQQPQTHLIVLLLSGKMSAHL